MFKRTLKILFYIVLIPILLSLLLVFGLYLGITPKLASPPVVTENIYAGIEPTEIDSGLYVLDNNWFRHNRYGLWEMYIEGDAFNRGVAAGKLSDDLVRYQEEVFIDQINRVLPSKGLQRILLTTIAWMNRKMPDKVADEFKKEIYGISLSASDEFNKYGPSYLRILNYHAAHDIGHAVQSIYKFGCSSFAAWDDRTFDSSLYIGRNFDFYFGDDFSRNKIIEFVLPDTGYNFAFITWGGMAGVVSGMNDLGLTVTINAGTIDIGRKAATPVTLVAREILQFAGSIDEAIAIASARKINVSETFMIGSGSEKRTVLIEKNPEKQHIYESDSSVILCTNHFQSNGLANEVDNIENRENNATGYRYLRLKELVNRESQLSSFPIASILRDKNGLNDASIGYGNEKALNQFIAHHAVIFNPVERIIWISTAPNVMGPFVAYDLNTVFTMNGPPLTNKAIDVVDLEIPADTFLDTRQYANYIKYKLLSDSLRNAIKANKKVADDLINEMILTNPDYFDSYLLAGDYYFNQKSFEKALINYKLALNKETNTKSVTDYIKEQISLCK